MTPTFAPGSPASANVNFPDGTTTSILILKGNPGNDHQHATPEPVGFVDNPPAPKILQLGGNFKKNDPYPQWLDSLEQGHK